MVWTASQHRYYRKNKSSEQLISDRAKDKARKRMARMKMATPQRQNENQMRRASYLRKQVRILSVF